MVTEGVINPIEVDENYVIVTGEMRWRAATLAGLSTIPAKIIKISPEKRFLRQVIENIHHNTMTDWDTAKALEKLRKEIAKDKASLHWGGLEDKGVRKLSRLIGKSQSYIIEHLNILGASETVQKAVREGRLSMSFIRILNRTPEEFKDELEKRIIKKEFASRDVAMEVAGALKRSPDKAKEILAVDYSKLRTPAMVIQKLSQIIPRFSDVIRESYTPPKELSDIKDSLLNWLNKYPHQILAPIHYDRTTLTFQVMVDAMNHWTVNRKALNDKYRSRSQS